MPGYIVMLALALMVLLVALRGRQLRQKGIRAFHFGSLNRRDFFIPPFVLLLLYLIAAGALGLPTPLRLIGPPPLGGWPGAALCALAPALFLWGLISFGGSFRVGIDPHKPGPLVTWGAFAVSRNPLYLAFFMYLCGLFLVYPSWAFFAYFVGGLWLIDRQVCAEEAALHALYGPAYMDYCSRVRRYL